MAKADVAEQYVIGEYAGPAAQDNPYEGHVTALIEADKAWPEEKRKAGRRPTISINIPTTETTEDADGNPVTKDVTGRYIRFFQEAAKAQDKTARIVSRKPQGDDSLVVEFYLTEKVLRPRKNKAEDQDTDDDTPVDEALPEPDED